MPCPTSVHVLAREIGLHCRHVQRGAKRRHSFLKQKKQQRCIGPSISAALVQFHRDDPSSSLERIFFNVLIKFENMHGTNTYTHAETTNKQRNNEERKERLSVYVQKRCSRKLRKECLRRTSIPFVEQIRWIHVQSTRREEKARQLRHMECSMHQLLLFVEGVFVLLLFISDSEEEELPTLAC